MPPLVLQTMLACGGGMAAGGLQAAPLLQPGDRILAFDRDLTSVSSSRYPFNHSAAQAVDGNILTKYENQAGPNSGLILTLANGPAVVSSFTITSAGDHPENDPLGWELHGTNDPVTSRQHSTGGQESWTLVDSGLVEMPEARLTVSAPVNTSGTTAYRSWRIVFTSLRNTPPGSSAVHLTDIQFYDNPGATGTALLSGQGPQPVAIQRPTPVISSYPAGETPRKLLDGLPAAPDDPVSKYLNFGKYNTGFIVTPSAGSSVARSFIITTGNDTEARDPASWALYGTNDPVTSQDNSDGSAENWTLIGEGILTLPAARSTLGNLVSINSASAAWTSYRMIFPRVKNPSGTNSMQLSEIQFYSDFGGTMPLFAPADPVLAVALTASSSDTLSNGPLNEPPAALLDGNPATKYLNFGRLETGFIVTPAGGPAVLRSFVLTTANDAEARDPAGWVLHATNSPVTSPSNSNGHDGGEDWVLIGQGPLALPSARLAAGTAVNVDSIGAYRSWRLTFPTVKDSLAANSMQLGDVQFFTGIGGTGTPLLTLDSPILAVQLPHSESNYPAGEKPAQILDADPATKYLNRGGTNCGFIVTPAGGPSVATGFTITTANDVPGRDPMAWELHGTNTLVASPDNGTGDHEPWTFIAGGTLSLPEGRLTSGGPVTFSNSTVWTSYRFTVTGLKDSTLPEMQIGGFQLEGTFAELLPEPFAVTGYSRDPAAGTITLAWPSAAGETFRIAWSPDLSDWSGTAAGNIPAANGSSTTTLTFPSPDPAGGRFFLRVERY